jgi:hypothetical protein
MAKPVESEGVDDVGALEKLTAALVARLTDLEQRRKALFAELRALPITEDTRPLEPRAATQLSSQERLTAELLGREPVLTETARALAPNERLFVINASLRAIDEAIKTLRAEYQTERLARSRLISARLKPENARHVATIARALLALRAAQVEYLNFTEGYIKQNVELVGLDVMHPDFAGHPNDRSSRAAYYIREAAQHGFIAASEVPAPFGGKP